MAQYSVYVDDNFHYMDEDERYKLADFPDCASATAACQGIVDDFLVHAAQEKACTATELYSQYTAFGEDPWIQTDDPNCRFWARPYAEARCRELATKQEAGREGP
jgi:hypothetical protein